MSKRKVNISSVDDIGESVVLPVIPMRDIVLFPMCMIPLTVTRSFSINAINAAMSGDKKIFLCSQKSIETEAPGLSDLYEIGTIAEILQVLKSPDNTLRVLVEGIKTARLISLSKVQDLMTAECNTFGSHEISDAADLFNLRRIVEQLFEDYVHLSDKMPDDAYSTIRGITQNAHFIYAIANYSLFSIENKQKILQMTSLRDCFKSVIEMLIVENDILNIKNKIADKVRSQIGNSQKEYYLNEQLKAIEHELGVDKDNDQELEDFANKIDESSMPESVKDKANRELNRLGKMQTLSPEATVSRTYLEWILDIPWGKYTHDNVALDMAAEILDEDHYGLKKIKERIVEFLAVHHLTQNVKGPILCLVGPPGVGKTSLAKSIARALGRKFVRMSLGGVRDEAEIRGHRKTYIGSMPGKIVQCLKRIESMNPVMLLDEIDKMSSDFRGDPASAMLEVLDPEQNKAFNDHYMEFDLDLSKVMFITTANTQSGIPLPLLDRMEILRIPGYTEDEKLEIAKRFLVPRQIKENGLTGRSVSFTQDSLKMLIDAYTREAGVRNLERKIASVCRKVARQLVTAKQDKKRCAPFVIKSKNIPAMLGPIEFQDTALETHPEIGTAIGLAWTEVGGELLPTEVLTMQGRGNLLLTGKLGDVMQESAKAALSWIRAHSSELGIAADFHRHFDIHIHVPEGAIPKDGPSAGVTIVTALVSALSSVPVREDIAMTGEITLRGNVLKIGGLKEKALAAHRHHIRTVLIPKDNLSDLEDIAPEILSEMTFIPVTTISQVLAHTLCHKVKDSTKTLKALKAPKTTRPRASTPRSQVKGLKPGDKS